MRHVIYAASMHRLVTVYCLIIGKLVFALETRTDQTPLDSPGPANALNYTFEHVIIADGNRFSTLQDFTWNTGDEHSYLFMGQVYDNGVLKCEEPLVPDRPPWSSPADILFSASQYNTYSGKITPSAYP